MTMHAIARRRLQNQCITGEPRRGVADLVAWLGAVQAQEYPAAKWGLALRLGEGTTDAAIEKAFDAGRILRTHVMRPTWHFVTPLDIRWMLELTAPRVHRRMAPYNRHLELDAAILTRATVVLERALRDGRHLTRGELASCLARAGIAATGQRLAHIALHAELEGVICSGPRRGTQFTYALLADRAPRARRLSRDEALAELTRRYFRSHGPATIRDFVWWSGLLTADARKGLEINGARHEAIGTRTYWSLGRTSRAAARHATVQLLPIYDEYLVAYQDRDAVPHWWSAIQSASGRTVSFQHALVIDGEVAGTWRSVRTNDRVTVDLVAARRMTATEKRGLAEASDRYGRFLDVPVSLSLPRATRLT
jgi:hypothetical protein